MTYICLECGNIDRFRATQDVTQYVTEQVYMDGEGDVHDWGDSDQYDSEVNDGPNDITCEECDSDQVENIYEEAVIERKIAEIEERNNEDKRPKNWKEVMEGKK